MSNTISLESVINPVLYICIYIALPITKAGLTLPNPCTTAVSNFLASQAISYEIVFVLLDPTVVPIPPSPLDPQNAPIPGPFCNAEHHATLFTGRHHASQQTTAANQNAYYSYVAALDSHPDGATLQKCVERCCLTGSWLAAHPGLREHTSLSAHE